MQSVVPFCYQNWICYQSKHQPYTTQKLYINSYSLFYFFCILQKLSKPKFSFTDHSVINHILWNICNETKKGEKKLKLKLNLNFYFQRFSSIKRFKSFFSIIWRSFLARCHIKRQFFLHLIFKLPIFFSQFFSQVRRSADQN